MKKNMNKIKRFNYSKKDYFSRDSTEPKKFLS